MAFIDKDYELIGVLNRRGDRWSWSEDYLDSYFIPKKPLDITREYIEKTGRDIGYTKSPAAYVFRRNRIYAD